MILGRDEVHVYTVRLDQAPPERHLQAVLSVHERARASAYVFARDALAFATTRGALRVILNRYLGADPSEIAFQGGPQGKPSLAPPWDEGGLRFNVSHSCDVALIAVARDREVGVDVERLRDGVDLEGIARRFFSPTEVSALLALPQHHRQEAFFSCWTRKEAYIKARGSGLSMPLDGFDVSLAPDAPAALLTTRPDPMDATRWSLYSFDPALAYRAALAVERAARDPSVTRLASAR